MIAGAPSEPTPRILDLHVGHIMSRMPEIRLYILPEVCRSNMDVKVEYVAIAMDSDAIIEI